MHNSSHQNTGHNQTNRNRSGKNFNVLDFDFPAGHVHLILQQFAELFDFLPTVGQLVNEKPSRARLFERLGIEYCCGGGQKTLTQACRARGLDFTQLVDDLHDSDAEVAVRRLHDDAQAGNKNSLQKASIDRGALAKTCTPDAILSRVCTIHHLWLRRELPRLCVLAERVASKHGNLHPEMWEIQSTFNELREQIEERIGRHETVLFPLCTRLIHLHQSSTRDVLGREAHYAHWRLHHLIEIGQTERRFLDEVMTQIHDWEIELQEKGKTCTTLRVLSFELSELDIVLDNLFRDENLLLAQADKLDDARLETDTPFAPAWMLN